MKQYEQCSWYTERVCSVPVRPVLILESRIGCNGFRISSTLNRELFHSDTSDLRTDELMILHMHDSANSDCLWLAQQVWTKLLDNWFCANAIVRVNRGPEWGRNVCLFNNKKIKNYSQWIMYSKWIMVSALMITNLFTLYLQDLNPRTYQYLYLYLGACKT